MALYRCAACGSPNVMKDIHSDGISYNYKKGIVGAAILGTGGAVAGLESKTSFVFKCPDCGITLTYPMAQEIKVIIDAGVNDLLSRNISLFSWSDLTEKYPNIESGRADLEIELHNQRAANYTEYLKEISKEVLEDIQTTLSEISILDTPEDKTTELQATWENLSKQIIADRQKEYKPKEEEALVAQQKELSNITQTIQSNIAKLQTSNQQLSDEKGKLNAELGTLGLFKGKRKNEIKDRLRIIDCIIQSNNTNIENENSSLASAKKDIEEKTASRISLEHHAIDQKYPMPKNPLEHKQHLLKLKKFISDSSQNGTKCVAIYKTLESLTKYSTGNGVLILPLETWDNSRLKSCGNIVYTTSNIAEICNNALHSLPQTQQPVLDVSRQVVAAILKRFGEEGLIEKKDPPSIPSVPENIMRYVDYYVIK